MARRFNTDGTTLTETFTVAENALSTGTPTIMALSNGGYTIGWSQMFLQGSYVRGQSVLRTYSDTDVAGNETPLGRIYGSLQVDSVELKYGGHVFVDTPADSDGPGVWGRFVGAGVPFQINTTETYNSQAPQTAALESGGFVVSWVQQTSWQGAKGIYYQVFDALGKKLSVEKLASPTISTQGPSGHKVIGTEDGGFVLIYTSGDRTKIYVKKYDETGSDNVSTNQAVEVFDHPAGGQLYPDAILLPDGGFLVVWTSTTAADGTRIMARRFSEDFTPVGEAMPVSSEGVTAKSAPSVSVAPDGSYVVSWSASGSGDAAGVFARAFDPQTFGTQKADTLSGDKNANWIDGLGGNDVLRGNNGADTLFGGLGNDMLFGGRGGDKLVGGAGIDTANYADAKAGVTADLQNKSNNTGFAAGDSYSRIENLSGSRFADKLSGNGGGNNLKGQAGNDVLTGRGGKDILIGGNGRDKLVGNGGADRFHGGTGGDTMHAGGDRFKDVFLFKSHRESLVGFKTRDKIFQFDPGEDYIDLRPMDANTRAAGNQEFSFSSGPAGNSIWVVDKGKDKLVRGDVTGDGRPDFEILVMSVNKLLHWDFYL